MGRGRADPRRRDHQRLAQGELRRGLSAPDARTRARQLDSPALIAKASALVGERDRGLELDDRDGDARGLDRDDHANSSSGPRHGRTGNWPWLVSRGASWLIRPIPCATNSIEFERDDFFNTSPALA